MQRGLNTVKMVESIVNDANHVLPCSSYLTGQYGVNDLYVGVPVKVGRDGVTEVVEVTLEAAEKEALLNSAEIYRKSIDELQQEFPF